MIEIEVTTNDDGYIKLEASGHAKSVICASVSTLLQSSVRFLQELSQQYPNEIQINVKSPE